MKTFVFGLIMVFFNTVVLAQTEVREGRHIFNFDISLTPCNFDGSAVGGGGAAAAVQTINANTIFTIRNVTATHYVIRISTFTKGTPADNAAAKNLRLVTSTVGGPIYFSLAKIDYEASAQRLENRGNFTVGAATTLIKIRPGKKTSKDEYPIYSEFGNDFNIGLSAGWKIRPNRRRPTTHSFVGGLSFSSIKVTPYTTKDFVSSEATQSCITFSLGYILEYNKFQVSAFSGFDIMSGEVGRHWIYKDRPWIGLGLGYQIFRAEGEKTN